MASTAWSSQDAASAEKALHELEDFLGQPTGSTHSRNVSFAKNVSRSTTSLPSELHKKQFRATYLDGLRGVAALSVYSLHHQGWAHINISDSWPLEDPFGWQGKYYLACFPGIRLLFSGGHLAVALFFVISGYVLSVKPLKFIQARDTTKLADNLGSALFRRWIRLYLPVIVTTFAWMTSWHLFGIRSSSGGDPLPEPTYMMEVWKWYCDFKNFSFIFVPEPRNAYNFYTWTIAAEFRGSIVIYTALLAFASFTKNKRLLCEAGLVYYFIYIVDGWFCALFVAGMLICDLELLAAKNELPTLFTRMKKHGWWIFPLLFTAAMWLGGVPSFNDNEQPDIQQLRKSSGWYFLSFFKPQAVYDFRWFFRFLAAILTVLCIPHLPWLKAFLEMSFCQYLGRVSYCFYLVQGPLLWTVGSRLYAASGRVRVEDVGVVPGWINLFPFPSWGPYGLEINYLIPHLILLPLNLLLAEGATKLIDEPSARFAQWLFDYDPSAKQNELPFNDSKGRV